MPKAIDRTKHFDYLSNEDLMKYVRSAPISVVSGKAIKTGSHEHRYQIAAIKKLLLKRRLDTHRTGEGIVFQEREQKETKESKPVLKAVERKPKVVTSATMPESNGKYPSLPVPTSELGVISNAVSLGVPDHLVGLKISNKSFF